MLDNRAEDKVSTGQIEEELARILDSHNFKASNRIRNLLKHLVTCSINGTQDKLTQRHLAEDVFLRGEDFDPEQDAIVRVEMRKLRQTLTAFYAIKNNHSKIIISIPSGKYIPEFDRVASGQEPSRVSTTPSSSPSFFSIAVLKFKDLSEDQRDAWIANGLYDEIMTILGRIPELKLLPPYQGRSNDDTDEVMRWLHDQHSVRFILEGSIRLIGSYVRVNTRLYDMTADKQIWSKRYERMVHPDTLYALEEEIAKNLISEAIDPLTGSLGRSLRNDLNKGIFERDEAYQAKVSFHRYLHETSDEAFDKAKNSIAKALQKNQEDPLLLSMQADILRAGYAMGFIDTETPKESLLELNERAIHLDPQCIPCRISYCFTLLHLRNVEKLQAESKKILSDLTLPLSYRADAAVPYALSGNWQEGCDILKEFISNAETYPHYFHYPLFLNHFRKGDYILAEQQSRNFLDTGNLWSPMLKAAVLAKLGDHFSAQKYLSDLLKLRPNTRNIVIRTMKSYLVDEDLIEDILDGLEQAGLT